MLVHPLSVAEEQERLFAQRRAFERMRKVTIQNKYVVRYLLSYSSVYSRDITRRRLEIAEKVNNLGDMKFLKR